MYLNDFLSLRPTHIQQKLNDTNISLLSLYSIFKLQTFKIPILKSNSIERLRGWFWGARYSSSVTGISFLVNNNKQLEESENILKQLIIFLKQNDIYIPFFIEAELDLKLLDKEPQTIFYYLLQSYFTTFNLKIEITNLKNEIEMLNKIYNPIKDLELGFTLTLDSDDNDILKHIDDLARILSVFKIKPNYIIIKNNNYELKNLIKEKIDSKLAESLSNFNNFSSNIYIEDKLLKTNLDEEIENQVFYSSKKLFKVLNMENSIPKMLNNLYNLGDEL